MTKEQKQKKWEKELARCEAIIDINERRIDPEIMDFVVVLNLLGFFTRSSCIGHKEKDGSISYPYIDVSSKKAMQLHEVRAGLLEKQKARQISERYFAKTFHENERILRREIARIGLEIETLLTRFYKTRDFGYDEEIKMDPVVVDIRILSNGCFLLPIRSKSERVKKLKLYQKEFRDFAAFLKRVYFKSK